MNLAIMGSPGSGKGTQAFRLSAQLGIVHISTGEILREETRKNSALGIQAKKCLNAGQLVPDDVVIEIVHSRLNQLDCADGFLLDGFPRTLPQAKMLDAIAPRPKQADCFLDRAIFLQVSEKECVRRLANRRTCPKCGLTYNSETHPSTQKGRCDACGSRLILREDDKAKTVKERFKVYNALTQPLIAYYKQSQRLIRIDGSYKPDIVFKNLINLL